MKDDITFLESDLWSTGGGCVRGGGISRSMSKDQAASIFPASHWLRARCGWSPTPTQPPSVVNAVFLLGAIFFIMATNVPAQTNQISPSLRAKEIFETARSHFQTNGTNAETGVAFARACFDWAEFAKANREREQIAKEGIAAARKLVERQPKLAAAHYYLGMNLAQLARTKSLGALTIIGEMEDEFTFSRSLDEKFDYAGADRNLGLLYLEAPSFLMGDKTKARKHLQSAVTLAPDYPENRLNLIEAYLTWGENKLAQTEFEALEKLWTEAKKKFTGVEWETSWTDWEKRFQKMKSRLPVSAKAKK